MTTFDAEFEELGQRWISRRGDIMDATWKRLEDVLFRSGLLVVFAAFLVHTPGEYLA